MKYDVIIIGGGTMGCAAAWQLSNKGKRVLLIEQWDICGELSAGHDVSKVFRIEYGNDLLYTKLALESIPLWHALETESKQSLYDKTGCLLLNVNEESYALQSYNALRKAGYDSTHIELFNEEQLNNRFPQFRDSAATFGSLGGILNAKSAVLSMASLAANGGVEFREQTKVVGIEKEHVVLEDGTKVSFRKLVVAAGAWISKLIDVPVTSTRQELLYLKPGQPELFSPRNFPVFAEFDWGWYGFPLVDGAVKISKHKAGEAHDPDAPRKVDDDFIDASRDFLNDCIPALANATVVKTGVCHYSMTATEDFIIDHLDDNIILAAGFSGHGFKFCPLVGAILSDLALDQSPSVDLGRFKIPN